jgi:hypothetical protein
VQRALESDRGTQQNETRYGTSKAIMGFLLVRVRVGVRVKVKVRVRGMNLFFP